MPMKTEDVNIRPQDSDAFRELIEAKSTVGWDQERRVHPVDVSTRLPRLPEGYFWRVSKGYSDEILHMGLLAEGETTMEERTDVQREVRRIWGGLFSRTVIVAGEPYKVEVRNEPRLLAFEPFTVPVQDADEYLATVGWRVLRGLPESILRAASPLSTDYFLGDYRSTGSPD